MPRVPLSLSSRSLDKLTLGSCNPGKFPCQIPVPTLLLHSFLDILDLRNIFPHKSLLSRFTSLAECIASRFDQLVTVTFRSLRGANRRQPTVPRSVPVKPACHSMVVNLFGCSRSASALEASPYCDELDRLSDILRGRDATFAANPAFSLLHLSCSCTRQRR